MADNQIVVQNIVLNPANWEAANQAAPIPLQQHASYGLALQTFGARVSQVQFLEGAKLVGTALLVHRTFLRLFRATTMFRGPLWHCDTITDDVKIACYQKLKEEYSPWCWNFLAVMPEEANSPYLHATFKRAGFKRIMTGFSTAWLDLRADEKTLRACLKGKWRNQLVKAEKADITISVGGAKPHQYNWLLDKESAQRSSRRYQATPLGLVPAFAAAATPKSGSSILTITAISNREKIAGAMFLLHGNSATYHIGWVGEKARPVNAQNRVLWEGMLALKTKGIKFLDLGGLNTTDLAGIARFKLGTGATPHTMNGTYI